MDKARMIKWMEKAEQILSDSKHQCVLYQNFEERTIYGSYDGMISALGVSVMMIGLQPSFAVYYQDDANGKPCRRNVLKVIAQMMDKKSLDDLRNDILNEQNEEIKKNFLDCAVALKYVVRTYNLKKDERSDNN